MWWKFLQGHAISLQYNLLVLMWHGACTATATGNAKVVRSRQLWIIVLKPPQIRRDTDHVTWRVIYGKWQIFKVKGQGHAVDRYRIFPCGSINSFPVVYFHCYYFVLLLNEELYMVTFVIYITHKTAIRVLSHMMLNEIKYCHAAAWIDKRKPDGFCHLWIYTRSTASHFQFH